MKTKTTISYESFDGLLFESADACKKHEDAHIESRFVGLTLEQLHAAATRQDAELADAFEKFGNQLASARRESGDLRRRPSKREAAPGEASGPAAAEPPAEGADTGQSADEAMAA